jgi:maltose/moltooligosaccharide transporter
MGVYMGIFNATITIPQIAAGLLGGMLFSLLGGQAVYMLGLSGASMIVAGISVLFIKENKYAKKN